jgi:hypothetical protein
MAFGTLAKGPQFDYSREHLGSTEKMVQALVAGLTQIDSVIDDATSAKHRLMESTTLAVLANGRIPSKEALEELKAVADSITQDWDDEHVFFYLSESCEFLLNAKAQSVLDEAKSTAEHYRTFMQDTERRLDRIVAALAKRSGVTFDEMKQRLADIDLCDEAGAQVAMT